MTQSPTQTGITVTIAAATGIILSRILEPLWGLWGFVAAMAGAALVAVGISVLLARRRSPR